MFSIQRLQNFVAVAEERQFLRAAVRLGLSQPTLSGQIRELETFLGVSLFIRTTRHIELTAEGERFYHRARNILADVEIAISEARQHADLQRGRVTIAATPSLAASILPVAISRFREKFPDVTIVVHEDFSAAVRDKVARGVVDIGLGPLAERNLQLEFEILFQEPFVALLPPSHPLKEEPAVTLAQLLTFDLLTTGYGTGIHDTIEAAMRDLKHYVRTPHFLARHETVLAMVEAGLGVALLPELGLRRLRCDGVTIKPLSTPELFREIGIIQRKGGGSSSAATAFAGILQESLTSFASSATIYNV